MSEANPRLFHRAGAATVQSLNVQAALGPRLEPKRGQFSLLVRHFLERFFNHENSSASGDGMARLIQMACAAGLPGMIVAMYLWPAYHPFPGWPPGQAVAAMPSYWAQANHHFFFVLYSFVAMGLIVVFQWDLLFPDLLDVYVLGPLPIPPLRQLLARIAAIAIFIVGFLFDANLLAVVILPLATEPAQVSPLVVGQFSSVTLAGLFSAGFVIALQSTLLALMGEGLYRRVSVLLQGALVAAFLLPLLLFPVLSGVTPALLQSDSAASEWFPPFWFLAVFERALPEASQFQGWPRLSHIAVLATVIIWGIAVAAYPVAHLRRVRSLIQGTSSRRRRKWFLLPLDRLLHATILRAPLRGAVFHFIAQTLLRVPRYRIYLVLSGGVGFSIVVATILRLDIVRGHLQPVLSQDGFRVAIGIVAFWIVAGLRVSFLSPGNQPGSWIFRAIHGKPPHYSAALPQLEAAPLCSFLAAASITTLFIAAFHLIAPPELRTLSSFAAQLVTGVAFCLILTDAFFLNTASIPFTGEASSSQRNLAFSVLRYVTVFPIVTTLALVFERLMERGAAQLGAGVAAIVVLHLWLRKWRRDLLRVECDQIALEEGEDDFLLRLGLRY